MSKTTTVSDKHAMDARLIIGVILAIICLFNALGSIAINYYGGWAIRLLQNVLGIGTGINSAVLLVAEIVAAVGILVLIVSVVKYHGQEELTHYGSIAMIIFLANNLLRVIGVHWSNALFLIPLILMVLQLGNQYSGFFAICAGVATMVLNIVVGLLTLYSNAAVKVGAVASAVTGTGIAGELTGTYIKTLLLSKNSLMGLACILILCIVCNDQGKVVITGDKIVKNNNGFGGGSGFGGTGLGGSNTGGSYTSGSTYGGGGTGSFNSGGFGGGGTGKKF